MKVQSVNERYGYVIKLERGDSVQESLRSFVKKENITGAFFYGLGAIEGAEVGYYNLEQKKYQFSTYPAIMEVASIKGNMGWKDGEPLVHSHVVLSDKDNQCVAGHLNEGTVAVTLEVFVHTVEDANMNRVFDEETGLYLLEVN